MLSSPVTVDKELSITDLTHATLDGHGVFDVLMRATKAHLDQEWTQGRIKGNEYATIYLGALQQTMQSAIQFLLNKDKTSLEIELAEQTKEKIIAETNLLIQKTITEKAQVDFTNVGPTSILGRQGTVFEKQAIGFVRKSEVDAAKVMIDFFTGAVVADSAQLVNAPTANLDAAEIGSVVNVMKAGIGAA